MGDKDVSVAEKVDARKDKRGPQEALALARAASEVIVAKGKKVVRFAMKNAPSDEELLQHLMGPTGNLRAPAIVIGKKLLVGFSDEAYQPIFGG